MPLLRSVKAVSIAGDALFLIYKEQSGGYILTGAINTEQQYYNIL
jgi:hypothetical protein